MSNDTQNKFHDEENMEHVSDKKISSDTQSVKTDVSLLINKSKDTLQKHRDTLSLCVMISYIVLVFASLLIVTIATAYNWTNTQPVLDIIKTLLASFGVTVGAIITFYFTSREK